MLQNQRKKNTKELDFFTEYGEANRYKILEIIGKGSYGVVCAAIDTHTGEKVAIKKINNIFEHVSDAIRILREIKLLRLLRHPDIVEIRRIMVPPSSRDFKDIYVVFELMESDLHQVIKANDDLTREHHRFFLYQMLRALKFMHTANVYHRDLKPKNILANANCKLKICDFGLARVAFNDTPTTVFWTDYIATRWYRAPELCGSFLSKYTPAIDIWSIGCIFAEVLTGKPLFPGKSVVHQLDLITDLLGSPSTDTISGVRNEKARKYLIDMRKKQPVAFAEKFANSDPLAIRLLQKLLAFDPKDRPTAEQALADPYFNGLAKVEREPSSQPISNDEFSFESRKMKKEDIRAIIYREILEYHPQLLKDYMAQKESTNLLYPSAVGQFKKQFAYLADNGGKSGPVTDRKHASVPRSTINSRTIPPKPQQTLATFDNQRIADASCNSTRVTNPIPGNLPKASRPPPRIPTAGRGSGPVLPYESSSRNVVGTYSSRDYVHNSLPQSLSPNYVFRNNTRDVDKPIKEDQIDSSVVKHTIPQPMEGKVSPGITPDMNSNPYQQQGQASQFNDPMQIDSKLLQVQSQLGAVGAGAVNFTTRS
ncbi:mitogen-activated protein kinase 18-like isoform X1 [Apium graveolens]|uniref:mitogen-activated protein kinase 18-like isoform X1 n=1 Tax=Apium graveolens TaxID=4045 RepID=UPI003D79219C